MRISRVLDSPGLMSLFAVFAQVSCMGTIAMMASHRLGTAEFAMWTMMLTATSLQLIAVFGFSPSATRAIAFAMAGSKEVSLSANSVSSGLPNWPRLRGLVLTTASIYRLAAFFWFLVLVSVGSYGIAPVILQSHHPDEGWIAWIIFCVGSSVSVYSGSHVCHLQGIGRIAQQALVDTLSQFTTLIVTVGFLMLGFGIVGVSIALLVSIISRNLVLRKMARRAIEPGEVDHVSFAELWPSTWRAGLGHLCTFGLTQSTGFWVAHVAQAREVAGLNIALRLSDVNTRVMGIPFYSLLPTWSRTWAAGDRRTVVRAAKQRFRAALYLSALALVIITASIPYIHMLLPKFPMLNELWWSLFTLALIIERWGAMHLQFSSITNHMEWHYANGGYAAIFILTCFFSWKSIGIYAIPLSMLLANVCWYAGYGYLQSHRLLHANRLHI